MWIFGYGSIIWKPGFEWVERRPGHIRGWKRRFWQGSTDHRGLPEAPGRVVTLLREAEQRTWGMAYRIDGQEAERVLAELDHREKDGYERHVVSVYHREEVVVPEALVYVAGEGNQNYLGPAPTEDIARHVRRSEGPSGTNVEYLLRLAKALRDWELNDDHVFAVEAALLEMMEDES